MKIEAMVVREDFYKINENTLKRYFKIVHGKDVDIKTKGYNFWNRIVIYPHLGSIVTRIPSRKLHKFWLNEYNVRNNRFKYIIAKLYVHGCFLSLGLLAAKGLYISDKTVFSRSTALIPGNRKIRIYNFKSGYVDAIIKDTFTHKYFDNELSFKLNNTYDFIPPIIEYGDDWYREAILHGQPLARIKDERLYQKCINDTIKHIGIIAKSTLKYVNVLNYSKNLYTEILRKMVLAKMNKHINSYNIILEIAEASLAKAILLEAPLPSVESHGDLQSGNVWVDVKKKKTYIIDWETHERRSVWYDCATLLLSTRRANKLKEMMDNCEIGTVKKAVLINDNRKNYNMQSVMGIITLEDIMFYLDDMLELPEDFGGDIFDRIAGELDKMGWRKTND